MGYIRKADYFKVKPMEEGAALESGLLNMIGEEVDEAYYTDTMSLCLDPELTERNGADTRIVPSTAPATCRCGRYSGASALKIYRW